MSTQMDLVEGHINPALWIEAVGLCESLKELQDLHLQQMVCVSSTVEAYNRMIMQLTQFVSDQKGIIDAATQAVQAAQNLAGTGAGRYAQGAEGGQPVDQHTDRPATGEAGRQVGAGDAAALRDESVGHHVTYRSSDV